MYPPSPADVGGPASGGSFPGGSVMERLLPVTVHGAAIACQQQLCRTRVLGFGFANGVAASVPAARSAVEYGKRSGGDIWAPRGSWVHGSIGRGTTAAR